MDEDYILLANCVVLDEYGRILLLHRTLNEIGQWELPGDNVVEDELPEEAAIRAVREQLGVQARLIKSLATEVFEGDDGNYKFHWFQAVIEQGEIQSLTSELFDDFDYIDLEDLPSVALSANMIVFENKLVNGDVVLD
ncbi:hypothetical protein BH09PAT3_BH09PAT3_1220 [soil metagenome]